MKKEGVIISVLIFILIAVVMSSGCTSSSNNTTTNTPSNTATNTSPGDNTQTDSAYKTYSGFLTFQYPKSWTIKQESQKWVQFNTPIGETRIWLYNTADSPVEYSAFQEKTIDKTTYRTKTDGNTVSYVIRKNGKDFFMVGLKGQESDYLHIITTTQF